LSHSACHASLLRARPVTNALRLRTTRKLIDDVPLRQRVPGLGLQRPVASRAAWLISGAFDELSISTARISLRRNASPRRAPGAGFPKCSRMSRTALSAGFLQILLVAVNKRSHRRPRVAGVENEDFAHRMQVVDQVPGDETLCNAPASLLSHCNRSATHQATRSSPCGLPKAKNSNRVRVSRLLIGHFNHEQPARASSLPSMTGPRYPKPRSSGRHRVLKRPSDPKSATPTVRTTGYNIINVLQTRHSDQWWSELDELGIRKFGEMGVPSSELRGLRDSEPTVEYWRASPRRTRADHRNGLLA